MATDLRIMAKEYRELIRHKIIDGSVTCSEISQMIQFEKMAQDAPFEPTEEWCSTQKWPVDNITKDALLEMGFKVQERNEFYHYISATYPSDEKSWNSVNVSFKHDKWSVVVCNEPGAWDKGISDVVHAPNVKTMEQIQQLIDMFVYTDL